MPKRSKDRPAEIGDEDYDWIKYLGEGRATASSPAPPDNGAAPSSPGSSALGSRTAPSAPAPRRSPQLADDDAAGPGSVPTARSTQENGSSPRRHGRDDGGRRRRDRDQGPGRRAGSAGRSAAGDDTGPGGFGLDNYSLDHYGAIGSAAYGHGGDSGDGRGGYPSDRPSGSGPGGSVTGGRSGDYGSLGESRASSGYRPDGGDSRTTPGRAVRLTAGRAVDLQANSAEALFNPVNPAAADYGQPLYAVPDDTDNGRGWNGAAGRDALEPGPRGRSVHSLYDTGVRPATDLPPAWQDDPLADTDPDHRTRALPAARPDSRGWPEFEDRSGTASWPNGAVQPGRADGTQAASWAEATGWPETDEEQATASWSEPTGWPEVADETAFAPDSDHAGDTRPAEATAVASPPGRRQQKQSGRRQAGRKAGGRRKSGGRKKAGVRPEAAIANAPQPEVATLPGRRGDRDVTSTGPLARAAITAEPVGLPAQGAPGKKKAKAQKKRAKADKKAAGKGRRRGRRTVLLAFAVIVAALAVAAYVVLRPVATHVISTPSALGSFTKQDANATATKFKHRLMAAAGSDVKNVVAAVYQRSSGSGGTKAVPQIMVFIGGNLAGNASASSLISAYMTQMHGSFAASPGKLGGEAACAPGSGGGPAECAWADGDTFGVVVSASLKPPALANEMRQMRPLVEHASK